MEKQQAAELINAIDRLTESTRLVGEFAQLSQEREQPVREYTEPDLEPGPEPGPMPDPEAPTDGYPDQAAEGHQGQWLTLSFSMAAS